VSLLSAPATRPCKSGASKWTLKQVQGDGGRRMTVTCHRNITCHHKITCHRNIRHPELVSGSIGRLTLPHRWQTQPDSQIHPVRIFGINQIDFPRPMPIFQLLLARNRGLHRAKNLKMHQPVNRIFGGMPGCHTAPMLRKPLEQVRRYADIKRTIMLACKYIYAWGFFVSHTLDSASKWTLEQVQGDVNSGKLFRLYSHLCAVTLNLFQGPSRNVKAMSA